MEVLRKFFRFTAKNFVFIVGLLFIFVIGFLYAYIKPQGFVINGIFLLIVIGWIAFLIRYFWELMDKDK